MNIGDGSEGLPDLREFLDKLPRKPCPSKLPPEYCKICRRLNREVADYCDTRKLPERMVQKPEEEPELPEPEEHIRPAGIERAVKPEEPTQSAQRKSPLLERPDFHEGESSLEFVSSERSREEAKKSLPRFIPVKKKPRAFTPLEDDLPPPPPDFMAFDIEDEKPSIFRSPDSLGRTEEMFTLVSGDEAMEVEPIIVEAEVMEATETVFESSEGIVETVDMSGGAPDVEVEPPVFEFLPQEEPVFAEAVEVVEEPAFTPEPEPLMGSIEEAERGIQELVDEIAGTQEVPGEDELALDQAMFMPAAETPEGVAAPPKKKKKKIKKVAGKKPLKKKKKKVKKAPTPADEGPVFEAPPVGEPAAPGPEPEGPLVPVAPPVAEPMAQEPPAQIPPVEEPSRKKKKKKMKLKKVKRAAPPEEPIPEALPAEEPPERAPVAEEPTFELPQEDDTITDDFLTDESFPDEPSIPLEDETVPEDLSSEKPMVEEAPPEESAIDELDELDSFILPEDSQEIESEEPVAEEEQPVAFESDTPTVEEEATEPPAEEEQVEESPEEEAIDMESFEPPYEAGFFFPSGEDAGDTGLGGLGLEEEEKSDFESNMKKLDRAPGFEIKAPSETEKEATAEEPKAEPEAAEPSRKAKKLKLKKKKKMRMKKLKMKPRKKAEDEEVSEGGEETG